MKISSSLFSILFVLVSSTLLFMACDEDGAFPNDGDYNGYDENSIYYDVVTTIKYKYEQPGVGDCPVNPATYEATVQYTMPGREYMTDGCGEEYDGILHVLCSSETTSLAVIESNNGAEWEDVGDVSAKGDYLSVFRKDGKTWLDMKFDVSSLPYDDPGCSGEQVTTNVWINTTPLGEDGDDYITFDEIDLSLSQDFTWEKTFESGDQCDVGCYETVEVEVHFIPVDAPY